jgi:hypothetical protein
MPYTSHPPVFVQSPLLMPSPTHYIYPTPPAPPRRPTMAGPLQSDIVSITSTVNEGYQNRKASEPMPTHWENEFHDMPSYLQPALAFLFSRLCWIAFARFDLRRQWEVLIGDEAEFRNDQNRLGNIVNAWIVLVRFIHSATNRSTYACLPGWFASNFFCCAHYDVPSHKLP